jgi:DNA invertase Pin-like site-specific DNA recombinase
LRDVGVSAFKGKNRSTGALKGFLDLVESGQVARGSFLVVESLDRISREAPIKALPGFLDLVAAGITIVTLADGAEYSDKRLLTDWSPLLVSLVTMARAHEESRTKGLRLAAAWAAKKHAAATEKKPLTSRCPEWLRLSNGKYYLVPERAAIVRKIFKLAQSGYGRRRITVALNKSATPTFRGRGAWHDSYVCKILGNAAVYGRFQAHKRMEKGRVPDGPPVDGYFPVVIPESTFWAVQGGKDGRARAPGRPASAPNLLTGLMRCRHCGGRMSTENKGAPPRGGRYARCHTNARAAGCSNGYRWRLDEVERAVVLGVRGLDIAAVTGDSERNEEVAALQVIAARIDRAKRTLNRYLDAFEQADDEVDEHVGARIRRIQDELKSLEAQRRSAEKSAGVAGAQDARESAVSALAIADRLERPGADQQELRTRLAEELRHVVAVVHFARDAVAIEYLPSRAPKDRLALRLHPAKNRLEAGVIRRVHPEELAALQDGELGGEGGFLVGRRRDRN